MNGTRRIELHDCVLSVSLSLPVPSSLLNDFSKWVGGMDGGPLPRPIKLMFVLLGPTQLTNHSHPLKSTIMKTTKSTGTVQYCGSSSGQKFSWRAGRPGRQLIQIYGEYQSVELAGPIYFRFSFIRGF